MTRVLVIDDSATIQKLVSNFVTQAGGQVAGVASDGDEGLTLYKKLQPDLVLLDITMPNKDGRECLKDILTSNSRAQIVMLSAINSPDVIKECLAIGAIGFLNKPSGIADGSLQSELQRYISKIAQSKKS